MKVWTQVWQNKESLIDEVFSRQAVEIENDKLNKKEYIGWIEVDLEIIWQTSQELTNLFKIPWMSTT